MGAQPIVHGVLNVDVFLLCGIYRKRKRVFVEKNSLILQRCLFGTRDSHQLLNTVGS